MSGDDYIITGILILILSTIVFSAVMILLHRWKKRKI